MTFAEYTKQRKEQEKRKAEGGTSNKSGGVQETVTSPSKDEKPKSFYEYTRKKKGVVAWRDEEQTTKNETDTSKITQTNPSQSVTDYSSAVKYLQSKGVQGASGIMTENEWRRRGRNGGTYQDYLDSMIRKYENGTTTTQATTPTAQKSTGEKWLDSAGYVGEKLGRGVIDGLEGLTDFAWSLIGAAGWGVTSGFGLFENSWSDAIENWYNDINENDITDLFGEAEERYDAAPDWLKDWGWLPETIGNLVPFMAETYFSGGSNMVDDVVTAGGSLVDDVAKIGASWWDDAVKFGKNAVDDVAKTVTNPKKLLSNPDVHFGMSAGGDAIETATEKGANPIVSTTYGAGIGAVEALSEKLFGTGYAGTSVGASKRVAKEVAEETAEKTLLKKIWNSPVTRNVLDVGTEWLEEDISAFADPILQRAIGVDANAEWASWSDYLESGSHGAILSVVMKSLGVPSRMIAKYGKSKVISKINDSTEVLNGLIQDDTMKFQPLPNIATEEEIVARQKEITAVALAYDNAVKKAVQKEQQTSVEQPIEEQDTLEKVAMDVVEERNRKSTPTYERLETLSQNNEPITAEEVKKVTGFGEEGSKLITMLANSEGMTFSQAKSAVETAYRAGLTDLKITKVNFDNNLQKAAFNAGKFDRGVQERVKQAEAKKAAVHKSGFTENKYSAKLNSAEREMFTTLAKDLKMDIEFVDKIVAYYVNNKEREANASHRNGKMEVSSTSKLPMVSVAMHEGFHRMRQLSPEASDALMNFLYETSDQNAKGMALGNNGISLFDQVKADYGNVDGMDTIDYIEEISAGRLETIFSSAEEFNKWRAELDANPQAKSAWQKFVEVFKEILEDIWASITNSKISLEAKRQAQVEIEQAKSLLADAYKGAMNAADKMVQEVQTKSANTNSNQNLEIKINEGYNGNVNYSLYDYPKLNKSEWTLLNDRLQIELQNNNNFIDDYTKWLYATKNNTKVFAIYGIGWGNDATPLYAVGGKNAEKTYNKMLNFMEGENEEFNGSREDFESWLNSYSFNKGATGNNISDDGNRRTNIGNGSVHSEQQASNRKRIDDGSSKNSNKVKHSLKAERYTEDEYHRFGWARENNILNAGQNADYRSKFADAKVGRAKFCKSKRGEYIIPVSDIYDETLEGINNVLVFAKGTIAKPVITSVIEIYEYDETTLDRVRRRIYDSERRGIQQKTGELFRRYNASDFEFRPNQQRAGSESVRNSGNNGHRERSSGEASSVKGQTKASYSLVGEYWHTDLSYDQLQEVEKWIRRKGNPESNRITNTANWYKGRIDGEDLFVIYSTERANNPVILYERKGEEARAELDILTRALEVLERERSAVEKSRIIDELHGGYWVQEKHDMANNNDRPRGRESNTGNASILQGKSSEFIGSQAFRNVIKNLFEKQAGINSKWSAKKRSSLKDSVDVSPKRRAEYFDAVEDVQKGKKGANERLAKYVDSGMIRTEEYEELIEKYGAIPKGERPHRDIQVPKKTADGRKVSQTVRTILEAKATPDEALPTIEKMVEDGIFSYDVYTDKQAINDAESYMKEYGWDESLEDWFDAVKKGEVSKQNTAMGWALYNNAANIAKTTTSETERTTAIKTSLNILDAMVRHQRSAAQALQATRVLKTLSPETQLYAVQKSVHALQKELIDRYGDKAPGLIIDEELAEQFINAKTPEERAEIEKKIYKDIGRQMPSRFIDKWNAWRYLEMLGNLRTHIRNIVGNAGFAPVVVAKNMTATAIESVVYRVSAKKTVRGKSIIVGNKADRKLLKAAWSDFKNVADRISNGGKYNDFAIANQQIEEGRQIFKFKTLEWAREKNRALLEIEDMWFSQPHYAYALAQYCKANNITAEQITKGKAIAPGRDYAIKEAQKATYRDTNAFSQMVSEWGRSNKNEKNAVKKAFNTVIEGILPFRKTPANILVRGVEYSPLGLLKGLSYDLYKVSKGEMSATEAIDDISAGLTGTGLIALGVLLAAQGLIRGHGEDDEKEKGFKELMGHQAYSLELPNGQSITLDWLAPEALPFFVGVNIWESTKGFDEEANLSTILKSVSNISEPMLEMSCLQALNELFEDIGYASSNDTSGLASILSSAATSYLTQGLPTLFGQAERTGEKYRMATYTEKDSFLTSDMQYTLGKASAKIPFWDYNQIPYIDAWGRKEASGTALKRGFNNFLNPAYTSVIDTSDMEKELLRLYEKTGENGVFPSRADKFFTVNGVRKDLTADEYVKYASLKGEKSYKLVSDLVNSKAYKKLTDEEKAKAVREVYDYANQKAKQAISNYKPETWVKKTDEFGSNVGNYISFKTEVSGTKENNGGKISKQEVVDIILNMAQNDSETWKMYLSMYDSNNDMYAYNKGIEGGDYMDFLVSLDKYDKPTKSGKYGTYTQEEAYRAIKQLKGLSRQEKAILWQSVNTSWKTKNNPFR